MREVEITQGTNGYPRNLYYAMTDFDSFEDAEKYAEENNGEVVEIHKKDGWQLWENRGRAYEGLGFIQFINEQDWYYPFTNKDDRGDLYNFFVVPYLYDEDASEEFKEAVADTFDKVISELDTMADEDVLVYDQSNGTYEVYHNPYVSFSYDTHTYQLAVVVED